MSNLTIITTAMNPIAKSTTLFFKDEFDRCVELLAKKCLDKLSDGNVLVGFAASLLNQDGIHEMCISLSEHSELDRDQLAVNTKANKIYTPSDFNNEDINISKSSTMTDIKESLAKVFIYLPVINFTDASNQSSDYIPPF